MQPVQNITVDDRVSRTQYQYTLEDSDADELNCWTDRFVERLKQLPQLEDVATDQQPGGLAAFLDDRSRHRVAPRDRAVDDRQHALRRVRPAADQHDVHAGEPVPRDARGRAASSRRDPSKPEQLYIQANASAGATGTGAATSFASSGSGVRRVEHC